MPLRAMASSSSLGFVLLREGLVWRSQGVYGRGGHGIHDTISPQAPGSSSAQVWPRSW